MQGRFIRDGRGDEDPDCVPQAQHIGDPGRIDLEQAGVVDRGVIAQLELEGIIDRDQIVTRRRTDYAMRALR
jgi:hypothetical protein